MTRKILFVCLGNICRSPAAQAVFRRLCPEIETDSAGTSGWHVGEPPYGAMIAAAAARGIEMGDLRARRFSGADFTDFDLIIGMDADNIARINDLRPAGNTTPVRLFTDFASDTGAQEVPDPYYTRDFDGALDLIDAAARGLATFVRQDLAGAD